MRQDITDEFGKLLIEYLYDNGMRYVDFYLKIISENEVHDNNKKYTNFLKNLSENQIEELKYFIEHLLRGVIPGIITIMEEHDDKFQICYLEGDKKLNLLDLHPFLLGEMNVEDGWIDRFSKYSKYNQENE